jgi:hypothetical protein
MFPWSKPEPPQAAVDHLEAQIKQTVREILTKALSDTETLIGRLKSSFDVAKHIADLKEQLETLKIEKARKDEEFARKERDIEHKVGLERKRQEFEIAQAKREATVTVREENLKADRDRFNEQLKFHEERFTAEVGYLKEMVGDVLKRLPTVTVGVTEERKANRR